MDEKKSAELVLVTTQPELPPILVGRATPAVAAQVRDFYESVAQIFERWVTRRASTHTQRAYRHDVMDFVQFLGLRWPAEATRLLTVSVAEVLALRDRMVAEAKASKGSPGNNSTIPLYHSLRHGLATRDGGGPWLRHKGPRFTAAVAGNANETLPGPSPPNTRPSTP